MNTPTFSTLFAQAVGQPIRTGPYECYYCGHPCGAAHAKGHAPLLPKKKAAIPDALFVCDGCFMLLHPKQTVRLADGKLKDGAKVGAYCWVVTGDKAIAATKEQHLDFLRETCLKPPAPPFAIVLADKPELAGLFRAPVCESLDDGWLLQFNGMKLAQVDAELAEWLGVQKAEPAMAQVAPELVTVQPLPANPKAGSGKKWRK